MRIGQDFCVSRHMRHVLELTVFVVAPLLEFVSPRLSNPSTRLCRPTPFDAGRKVSYLIVTRLYYAC
jgi:hypothetical protein